MDAPISIDEAVRIARLPLSIHTVGHSAGWAGCQRQMLPRRAQECEPAFSDWGPLANGDFNGYIICTGPEDYANGEGLEEEKD